VADVGIFQRTFLRIPEGIQKKMRSIRSFTISN
jgi:hypothetical protein